MLDNLINPGYNGIHEYKILPATENQYAQATSGPSNELSRRWIADGMHRVLME
jgi:hypothetical protein